MLILWRYQLHPASAPTQCPRGTTDAHSQKRKKNYKKKKFHYSDLILKAIDQTSPTQHHKFIF
jgi:hypothetical protein